MCILCSVIQPSLSGPVHRVETHLPLKTLMPSSDFIVEAADAFELADITKATRISMVKKIGMCFLIVNPPHANAQPEIWLGMMTNRMNSRLDSDCDVLHILQYLCLKFNDIKKNP